MKWISLIIGGSAGTIARYLVSGLVLRAFGPMFPYGTLTVNLLGCFLVGFLAAFSSGRFSLGHEGNLLLMIGFCGAFTTFSAFILETANLMRDGETLKAFFNVTISITAGFLALRAGIWLGEVL